MLDIARVFLCLRRVSASVVLLCEQIDAWECLEARGSLLTCGLCGGSPR